MLDAREEHEEDRIGRGPRLALLVVMFVLAAFVRLQRLEAPGQLLDREYTSAIFARAFYFNDNDAIPEWRRNVASAAKAQQPVLEPPVLDYLIAQAYRVIGHEDLHAARHLTNAFWLVGGVFMFLVARRLTSPLEALVATAYYLFVPMGVLVSRSIQPDSLMMMLTLMSLHALLIAFEKPATKHLVFAACLSSVTLLLRPLVVFAIFMAYLALAVHRQRSWTRIVDRRLVLFSVISIVPCAAYYGYGIVFAGFMRWKVGTSFMPHLLTKIDFWKGWFVNVTDVAELTPLLLAAVGLFLLRKRIARDLAIALAVAFMIFSVAFTYHIHTHPYYHIQLIPIVGLCMAPPIVGAWRWLRRANGPIAWIPVAAVILVSAYLGEREVRAETRASRMEDPAIARRIGELIGHSERTVFVAYYYGVPLEYHGEFAGAPWPVRIEDAFYRRPGDRETTVEERLARLGFEPEYWVITHFDLFNRKHGDLLAYLEANCTVLARADEFLIYAAGAAELTGDSPADDCVAGVPGGGRR